MAGPYSPQDHAAASRTSSISSPLPAGTSFDVRMPSDPFGTQSYYDIEEPSVPSGEIPQSPRRDGITDIDPRLTYPELLQQTLDQAQHTGYQEDNASLHDFWRSHMGDQQNLAAPYQPGIPSGNLSGFVVSQYHMHDTGFVGNYPKIFNPGRYSSFQGSSTQRSSPPQQTVRSFQPSASWESPAKGKSARFESSKCEDCGKPFRKSPSHNRCSRCAVKFERAIAEPPVFYTDENVSNLDAAKQLVFPIVNPSGPPEDDFDELKFYEDQYIVMLVDAINMVQLDEPGVDTWPGRQQKTFNQKAKLEKGYSNAMVTARLRCLFQAVIMYHEGGAQSIYAVGGDNTGYTENRYLKFSDRLAEMVAIMRVNKRVVMDIIEGRGVLAFVGNPKGYHKRKDSNNDCNAKKKGIMDKGKAMETSDMAVAGPSTGRKRRHRDISEDNESNVGTRKLAALATAQKQELGDTQTPFLSAPGHQSGHFDRVGDLGLSFPGIPSEQQWSQFTQVPALQPNFPIDPADGSFQGEFPANAEGSPLSTDLTFQKH